MNTPFRVPPRGPRPPASTRARTLVPAPLLSLLLVLALVAGCSSDDGGDGTAERPAPGATETATTTSVSGPAPLTTRAEIGTVVGRLPGERRKAVREQVTEVLDRWWDAAYVGGAYPRTDFGRYPGFTPGATRRATYDRDLMSNADIGDRVVSVTPLMRKARLDLLVRRPAGAVGHRALRPAHARRPVRARAPGAAALQVRGRVFLTRQPAGWRDLRLRRHEGLAVMTRFSRSPARGHPGRRPGASPRWWSPTRPWSRPAWSWCASSGPAASRSARTSCGSSPWAPTPGPGRTCCVPAATPCSSSASTPAPTPRPPSACPATRGSRSPATA